MLVATPRKALKACALVVAVNLVGCGATPDGDTGSHGGAQGEALVALGVGGTSALAAIALPVAVGVAAGAIVTLPLIVARDDYEQGMEQALRTSLTDWFDAGAPADFDWYQHAMQTFLPVASDVARADFAAQFVEESSPEMIARFANPSDAIFTQTGLEVALSDVAELHSGVIAHIAAPHMMVSLAESALVPGFMGADEFADVVPQILESFGLVQQDAFSGIIHTELAQATLQQIHNLSTTLMNATGVLTNALQAQYAVRAQVHSAFVTQLLTIKARLNVYQLTEFQHLLAEATTTIDSLAQDATEGTAADTADTLDRIAEHADDLAAAAADFKLRNLEGAAEDARAYEANGGVNIEQFIEKLAEALGVEPAIARELLRDGDPATIEQAAKMQKSSYGKLYDAAQSVRYARKWASAEQGYRDAAQRARAGAALIREKFKVVPGTGRTQAERLEAALRKLLAAAQ